MKSQIGMRPVFDASAVLAIMQGETGSDKLWGIRASAVVSAVNASEVLAKLVSRGLLPAEAQAAYDGLHLQTLACDPEEARLSAKFVGKGISLGDRCFLAAAHRNGTGWTSDRGLKALVSDGVPALHFFR